jgi:hypothetical protein
LIQFKISLLVPLIDLSAQKKRKKALLREKGLKKRGKRLFYEKKGSKKAPPPGPSGGRPGRGLRWGLVRLDRLRRCAHCPAKLNPKLKPIVKGSNRFQNIAIIWGITNMVKATHPYDITSVPRRQAIYRSEPIYHFWHFSSLCFFCIFSAHFLYF